MPRQLRNLYLALPCGAYVYIRTYVYVQAQLDSRDSHAEELRRIFDEDRARWEVEAKELRKRLQVQEEKVKIKACADDFVNSVCLSVVCVFQFSEERQKLSNRHAADRSEKEKALQDAELEVVRQSSQVKSEAAERIKHVKVRCGTGSGIN